VKLISCQHHPKTLGTLPVGFKTSEVYGWPKFKGAWCLPSGISGEVTIQRALDGRQEVVFTWNRPPADDKDLESFAEILYEVLERAKQALDSLNHIVSSRGWCTSASDSSGTLSCLSCVSQ
jgi:hypothetical protein